MKVSLKQLWETGGSLQRFGEIKFKGSIGWKAGRIHRAAIRHLEELGKSRAELEEINMGLLATYGTEVERKDSEGNTRKVNEVKRGTENWTKFRAEVKKLEDDWNKSLNETVELVGAHFTPFTLAEIGEHLDELSAQDIGALSEWMIVDDGEAAGDKASAAASGD